VYPTVPPQVEYEATDLAKDLFASTRALSDWAEHNHERLAAARMAYDSSESARAGVNSAVEREWPDWRLRSQRTGDC